MATKVVIDVENGVITSITADADIEIMVVDHDSLEAGDEFPEGFYFQHVLVDSMGLEEHIEVRKKLYSRRAVSA